jgi:hypothetical protein
MIAEATLPLEKHQWSQVFALAWSDDEFKQRLIDDPHSVLAEHGIEMPLSMDIKVVEDTATARHLVLPPPPTDELTEEELTGDAAAYCFSGDCGRCGCGCDRCGRCRCD